MLSDHLLTQEEFAELAGVTQSAISQMISKGRLATYKGGLIDPTDSLSMDYRIRRSSQRRRAERERDARKAEQDDDDTDGGPYSAEEVQELLRLAFACDAGNINCALDTYSHLKLGAKIAKVARSAKDMPAAVKTVERALIAFLKMYANDIKLDGDCFIKAWHEDDLAYYMNGPTDEELAEARAEIERENVSSPPAEKGRNT